MLRKEKRGENMFRIIGHIPSATALPYDWVAPKLFVRDNISEMVDLRGLLGYPVSTQLLEVVEYSGWPPTRSTSRYLASLRAWTAYVYHVKQTFSGDWNFSDEKPITEHPVQHKNLYGEVPCGCVESLFYNRGTPDYDHREEHRYTVLLSGSQSNPSISFSGGTWPVWTSTGRLDAYMSTLSQLISSGGLEQHTSTLDVCFGNFECRISDMTVTEIVYTVYVHTYNPTTRAHTRQIRAMKWEMGFTYHPTVVSVPYTGRIDYRVKYNVTRWNKIILSQSWTGDADPGYQPPSLPPMGTSWAGWATSNVFVGRTAAAHGPITNRFPEFVGYNEQTFEYYMSSSSRNFINFQDRMELLAQECYTASFFSTKAAVDEYFARMESNHIEAIAELGDLLRIVDLVKALKALKRSPIKSGKTLFRLLNLMADAKLSYSLGLAPTISDAVDVSEKAKPFLERFSSQELYGWQTLRGKWVYQIPEEFDKGFPGLHLVARSKVTVRFEPDSYLTALLPIRSLGLLPTLSSLWDLIPFSFVVDWFTHLGDHLDDVETTSLIMMLSQKPSVHSISLNYAFTDADRDDFGFGLSMVSDLFTGYRFYERFILPALPTLGPSRLPFHGQASIPDWGTAASLLFKVAQ